MKTLLIIILSFLSLVSNAQEYPKFETDSMGKTTVLFTLEQAQKLDNSIELLILFEKLNGQLDDYDTVLVKIIGEKNKIINVQEVQIKTLKEALLNKEAIIENLNITIAIKDKLIQNHKTETQNVERQLGLANDRIKELKTKMFLGGTLGSSAIMALILLLVL